MRDFIAFAETAFASRAFRSIVDCFEAMFADKPAAPLSLAWLARACFELGEVARTRCLLAQAIGAAETSPDWAKALFQHAVWTDPSPFEPPPEPLMRNVEIFGHFVTALIERGEVSSPVHDRRFPSAALAMYWVRTRIRTVVLDCRDQDQLTWLQAEGLAAGFLAAAGRGMNGAAEACAALSSDVPFAAQPDLSPRLFDVAATMLLRGKPILCPFTGQRGLALDSIDLYVHRYQHAGRTCLILANDTAALATSDNAWFLPDRQLLIAATDWHTLRRTLARALSRAFDNRFAVARYLNKREERPVMVTDVAVGHIGHYIWNAISGWSRLFNRVPAEKINLIATHRALQIFGGVKELYPDCHRHAGQLIEIENEHEAYRIMLDRGALAMTLVDRHITNDMAARVIAWCRHNCPPEAMKTIASFRRMSSPMLLVTIRLENRAWIEQADGLPRIINELAQDFPGLGVVLDGLNAGIHSLDTHAYMSLDEEQRLVKHIVDLCPGVRIHDSVGCAPAESIVWCDTVDAFLAPIGAGMAKYRWITNKPGVAYSNETCLLPNSYDGRLYERHRDGSVPMEYVAREVVKDVDKERHGLAFRANFSMPWEVAYWKTRDFLTRFGAARTRPRNAVPGYPVERISGAWAVRFDIEITVPIRLGGQPVREFMSGWKPRHVYAGFAPILLLELVHENGMMSTWFLGEDMERLGDSLEQLSEATRAMLIREYRELAAAPWSALIASFEPFWPACVEGLSTVNPHMLASLAAAAGNGIEDVAWHDISRMDGDSLAEENDGGSISPIISRDHVKSILSMNLRDNYLNALRIGALSWPSPVTGRPVTHVHGLYIDGLLILYRCVDEESRLVFYVCCVHHDMRIAGVLFPGSKRVFYLSMQQKYHGETLAANLMSRVISFLYRFGALLPGYFSRATCQFATPLWGGAGFHIGHHLWNELSGLSNLVSSVLSPAYPKIIVLGKPGDGEAYGKIDDLFPELRPVVIRGMEHENEMVEFCIRENIQIIRVTGEYVSNILRTRVMRLVHDSPNAGAARVQASWCEQHGIPVVVLGLRVENRTVDGLEAFCLRTIEYLRHLLGRVAVVVDGHNSRTFPDGQADCYLGFNESRASCPPIEVERDIVRSLSAAFDNSDVTIVDNVGGSMDASLFWLDQSRFFIAPWGAGLAKYRWIANKPGLIVSSRWILRNKGDLHIYDSEKDMETPSEVRFIGSEHVFDLAEAPVLVQPMASHHPAYFNFKVNMGEVYKLIDNVADLAGVSRIAR
jgi:hypothetical protein